MNVLVELVLGSRRQGVESSGLIISKGMSSTLGSDVYQVAQPSILDNVSEFAHHTFRRFGMEKGYGPDIVRQPLMRA